jgi:hypothetical protein
MAESVGFEPCVPALKIRPRTFSLQFRARKDQL